MTIRRRRARLYALLTVALASAGIGAGAVRAAAPDPPAPGAQPCSEGFYERLETQRFAYGAAVRVRAIAYSRPDGKPIARFGRLNVNRVPTIFGVIGVLLDGRCRAVWYRVRLPRKPNGSVGWVRPWAVRIAPVRARILVDLSDRRVTLFRDGRRVLSTRAAIGSRATPTPTGSYYVNQRLIPANPGGPFGPGAIGISAFSEVLTGWTQGGPIAIHGTNRPYLIGQAISNGCIRVRNEMLRRLFAASVGGTPVTIRA